MNSLKTLVGCGVVVFLAGLAGACPPPTPTCLPQATPTVTPGPFAVCDDDVLWLKMDDCDGDAVVGDSSGEGNTGTFSDATGHPETIWHSVAGKVRGCLEFDGVDDYIDCGNDSSLGVSGGFTLAAWVRTNGAQATGYRAGIIQQGTFTGTAYYSLRIRGGGWMMTAYTVAAGFAFAWNTNDLVIDGSWHHVCGVFEANEAMTCYIDGQVSAATYESGTYDGTIKYSIDHVYIGKDPDANVLDGSLDNVRIFDRALEKEEVLAIWNLGHGTDVCESEFLFSPGVGWGGMGVN